MKGRIPISKAAAFTLGLVGAAMLAMAGGCAFQQEKDQLGQSGQSIAEFGDPAAQCWVLAQGPNNNDLGSVCIENDATDIDVTYTTHEPCLLTQVHVCADTVNYPWTPPGQCPYKAEFNDNPVLSYTISIPLSDFPEAVCDETLFYIQAHAQLSCLGAEESAYGGAFKGKIEYIPQCEEEEEGCTLTQGYWKNHPGDWTNVVLNLGGVDYAQAAALTVLKTPPKGDASLILAHQLIAAKLNIQVGGASSASISATVGAADAWLAVHVDADGWLPFSVPAGSAADAIAMAATLDDYNNGVIGPGHCDE